MDSPYIVNGEVVRDKIAMDIKYRRLKRTDIEQLCLNPVIQDAFRGSGYNDKKPKREWNKDYLGRLSYAVVGECFNREYLLYLDEVANFVSKAAVKKIVVAGVIIMLVIIAGIIVYTYIMK